MPKKSIPAVILGGSGYVAGELIGLLLNHPSFFIETIVSTSNSGTPVDEVFPHLTGAVGNMQMGTVASAIPRISGKRQVAVFSALPHGEAAIALGNLLSEDSAAKVVDVSADFRHADPQQYCDIYGKDHPNPTLLSRFICGLPDLCSDHEKSLISHPGCFSTGVSLAIAGLAGKGLIEGEVQASAVTGSTGAGRHLGQGTHHPHRQSSMWAYQPLVHRHKPEVEALIRPYLPDFGLAFVPHSGPFSRGIHATVFAKLRQESTTEIVAAQVADFYRGSPFVRVQTKLPTLKEVVGTNRCHIGIAVEGRQVVATSVIDNLVKGAAGGAIQWMNRLFGLEETEGLMYAVPGWI